MKLVSITPAARWTNGRMIALAALLLVTATLLIATGADRSVRGAPPQNCTITVNSTSDNNTEDGEVTLREAIQFATGADAPVGGEADQVACDAGDPGALSPDRIIFDLPLPLSSPAPAILLSSPLPPLDTGNDVIDAIEPVVIDGDAGFFDCVIVESSGNEIYGLQVQNCDTAIYVGTPAPVLRESAAPAGMPPVSGNFIGFNTLVENQNGIVIEGVDENIFLANRIGIGPAGEEAGNSQDGVRILNGFGNIVGVTGDLLLGARAIPAGGGGPPPPNVISGNSGNGITISGGGSNIVAGNYIGTDPSGTTAVPNGQTGIRINDSTGNEIGGTDANMRNVVSGNTIHGIFIDGPTSTLNVVRGNYIGTNAAGDVAIPNLGGVVIEAAPVNVIGGTEPGAGNVISGNSENGVSIFGGDASDNAIQANLIGTASNGSDAVPNDGHGVYVSGAGPNVIGGDTTDAGNVIAYNGLDGVAVVAVPTPSTGKTILRNSIHSNGGLGIDLEDDGVTLNDAQDVDGGANGRQNYPVLQLARTNGTVQITGTLNSTPETGFEVQFFANDECDDLFGTGEGQVFLGSRVVSTGPDGNVSFDVSLQATATPGQFVTATATDPGNNTSEFSACIEVLPLPTPPPTPEPSILGDVDCDLDVDVVDALYVLQDTAGQETGAGCLDQGDVQCNGARDETDALGILIHVALLPPQPQEPACPAIGEPIP